MNHATLTPVTGSAKFELEVGFDLEPPDPLAGARALKRWHDAVTRAGKRPASDVVMVEVRSAGLQSIGQRSFVITGEVIDAV